MEQETLATRINIRRFSKIKLLTNTTARILKIYKYYNRDTEHSPSGLSELKTKDIDAAKRFWIRDSQESVTKDVIGQVY